MITEVGRSACQSLWLEVRSFIGLAYLQRIQADSRKTCQCPSEICGALWLVQWKVANSTIDTLWMRQETVLRFLDGNILESLTHKVRRPQTSCSKKPQASTRRVEQAGHSVQKTVVHSGLRASSCHSATGRKASKLKLCAPQPLDSISESGTL